MPNLADTIRAAMDDITGSLRDDYQGLVNLDNLYALKPIAALRSVLALHPPVPGLAGSGTRFCLTCWLPGSERMEPAPWPCNTVARIAEQFGVSDTQGPTGTGSGGNPSPGGER